ncbi:MAG: LysR family transcriptional regulator [Planctomycetota bacterium]
MEIRQLHSFREVVREGSFTAAARRLHMTQPAISLHVKALEKEVGARLMDRDARGVRLTPAGEVLLEAAEAILGTVEDCRRRITEMEAPERGTLLLACGDTVALHVLPPILAAFRTLRPRAEITIRNHGSRRILDQVLRREADLGIVTLPPWLHPALEARVLLEEPFWLALPPGHGLAGREAIGLAALDGRPAVLLAPPSQTRGVIDRALGKAGVELRVVMESGNLEVVKAYVAGGMGLSILPAMAIEGSPPEGLVLVPLPDDFPRRQIALVRRRDRPPTLLASDLLRLFAERFAGD